ncbi:MAG: hypothetical protein ACOY0R_13140 [Chloroflexota bacterium]
MKENIASAIRILLASLSTGLAFCLLVAGIGWVSGWRTSTEFSNGFFLAGSAVIIFGLLALWGGFTSRGDFALTYTQTASDMPLGERAKWMATEVLRGYNVVVTTALIGLVMIGMSILTYKIFG